MSLQFSTQCVENYNNEKQRTNNMNKKIIKSLTIFALGVSIGVAYHNDILSTGLGQSFSNDADGSNATSANTIYSVNESKIKLCFTPPSGCAARVAREIDQAMNSIRMQAYGLTHPEISKSLISAKQRGVDVSILLDRSNKDQKYSKMKELEAAGIEITIDKVPGIAHNKIIVIDGHKTITGSMNFTTSGDTRNAENVLFIDDVSIAKTYLQNWTHRRELSQ